MLSDAALVEQKKKNWHAVDEHTVFFEDTARKTKEKDLNLLTNGMELALSWRRWLWVALHLASTDHN